jgi:drug/metabolite transporter (DMT)-like permease
LFLVQPTAHPRQESFSRATIAPEGDAREADAFLNLSPVKSEHRRAILGLLAANFLWGLSFPLLKALAGAQTLLVPESGNWFVTAMSLAPRFLLAAVILLVVARRQLTGLTCDEWRQGGLLAVSCALGMLLQVDGLQHTSASVSAFLTQFYAILIPVFLALRYRRMPSWISAVCVLLVVAGVAILGRFDFRTFSLGRGEWETLGSSVFFMWQILVLGDARYAANRFLPVSTIMFGVIGMLFAGLALATAPHSAADCLVPLTSVSWLGFTVLLTGCSTLGAFLLMIKWQPKITATEAGLIYCFEPVFASLMALFLPALFSQWAGLDYANETLTWQLLVGGGLITLANVLLQKQAPAKA